MSSQQNSYGDHIPGEKWVILDGNTEIKGVVGSVDNNSGDLYVVPDPNYRHLLIEGNRLAVSPLIWSPLRGGISEDKSFSGWVKIQENLKQNCTNLDSSLYPQPYPIIRLERYGFDGYPARGDPPPRIRMENGTQGDVVELCDHISARGVYVIDYSHTMYHSDQSESYCSYRGLYLACRPHAELHPYDLNDIRLVEPLEAGDANTETHTLVVPYYDRFYSATWGWNKVGNVEGRVVDDSKIVSKNLEFFIKAPPQPIGGCEGGCVLQVTENKIEDKGETTVDVIKEANGVRVKADVIVPFTIVKIRIPGSFPLPPRDWPIPVYLSDYERLPGPCMEPDLIGCSYILGGQYAKLKTTYTVKWSPRVASPPQDCINFNPGQATVQNINGSWKVVVGSMWMLDFGDNLNNTEKALAIIKHYGFTNQCFVGRPNAPMMYFLTNNTAPIGSFSGQDCLSFNPETTSVVQIGQTWKVVDGSHWILDFGANEQNARKADTIIKYYGFNEICFVGRPNAPMMYFVS